MSKTIGIKLADGSFYPILEEGTPNKKRMELTTVKDNQETVQVDLYRSEKGTMTDAEYMDSLQIDNLHAHPNGEPSLAFNINLDENNELSAEICDPESGEKSNVSVNLVTRDEKDLAEPANFEIATEEKSGGLLAAAEKISEETENNTETKEDDFSFETLDLPSFNEASETKDESSIDTDDLTEIEFGEPVVEDQTVEEAKDEDLPAIDFKEPLVEDSIPAPDFAEETVDFNTEDSSFSEDESFPKADETNLSTDDSFFSLPDFNSIDVSNETSANTFAAEDAEETAKKSLDSDEMASMDFDSLVDTSTETTSTKTSSTTSGLNFDNLYDEETLEGTPANDNVEVKKTKKHVVICFICAVICILATLLLLFVIPSELNLLSKNKVHNTEAATVPAPTTAQPLPPVETPVQPSAKEDTVVVLPTPQVVPAAPAPQVEKTENITYKIRWGDTLWDISDAYYRNPWKYSKIANYNRIKNPDHIISGTTIIIPAE